MKRAFFSPLPAFNGAKQMHSRIEKSGFRPGEYVGYCDGAWRITKTGDGMWRAVKNNGADSFKARTLDSIGKGLDERANIAVGKALFS
jgi:hypothetical protein